MSADVDDLGQECYGVSVSMVGWLDGWVESSM